MLTLAYKKTSLTIFLSLWSVLCTFAVSNYCMNFRLLIVAIISFICTAFANIADKIYVSENEILTCIQNATENHSDTISSTDFTVLNSGESNYTATNNCPRHFSKRQSIQRLPDRYVFHTNGKAYDKSFIVTYRNMFYHSHAGLIVPYHTHLSLGVLII